MSHPEKPLQKSIAFTSYLEPAEMQFALQADELDYAIRCKDINEAEKALAVARSSLDTALSSLL